MHSIALKKAPTDLPPAARATLRGPDNNTLDLRDLTKTS